MVNGRKSKRNEKTNITKTSRHHQGQWYATKRMTEDKIKSTWIIFIPDDLQMDKDTFDDVRKGLYHLMLYLLIMCIAYMGEFCGGLAYAI